MTQTMVIDIMRQGFLTIIVVSLPVLVTSMAVGLVVSILQAVTQVQEQTLSFVPKLISVMLALILFGNFMLNRLVSFARDMFSLIERLG